MEEPATSSEEDKTRHSADQITDLFRAEASILGEYSLPEFFERHPEIDKRLALVPLIVAELRRQESENQPLSPRRYFEHFSELAGHPDAWMILDSSREWLQAHEGPHWATAWQDDFPDLAQHFLESPRLEAQHDPIKGDLDNLQSGDRVMDFEIIKFIGEGAFGRVYLATELSLQRQCALKVTVDQGSEGQVLAKLSHGGIVDVYREHRISGRKLLAMRYIAGQSLLQWIASNVPNSDGGHIEGAVRLIIQVAQALGHAHVRGVLHRDIKPANILMDQAGNPLLSDFNVATAGESESRFTVGGTINYMSPEQLQAVCLNDVDAEYRIDTRSDIYSLGVVLLEVLTGRKTWSSTNTTNEQAAANELLASRLRSSPSGHIEFVGISPSLAAIVDKALSPDPDSRYRSAAELETDLKAWLDDRNNVYASNPSRAEWARRHVKHNRHRWIATVAIAAVILSATWIGRFSSNRSLAACDTIVASIHTLLTNRRIPQASEMLGEAKSQLRQSTIARWTQPERYSVLEQSLQQISGQLADLESKRFSSQFGEIVLREIHGQDSNGLSTLIKDTLGTYRVLTSPTWQQEAPYSGLEDTRKREIAERITELMLVAMLQSSANKTPSQTQIANVLKRLPREHQHFAVFN
ncbi:MAG: serine/threonine-protein kinase, partial [Planctomycetota bacterium]